MKLKKSDILEVEIELTGNCNFECPLCTRSHPEAGHLLTYNMRPATEIIAQLDEYPNMQNVCIAGIVSEPTLHKEFKTIVKYLVDREIDIELYSNTSVHPNEWWSDLASYFRENDRVFFTFCGSTQELHEKYRVNSSLSRLLEIHKVFKDACSYNIDCAQYIRFAYNYDDYSSPATKEILARFSYNCSIDSLPYNERFNILNGEDNKIKLAKGVASTYEKIVATGKSRYEKNKAGEIMAKMNCKSLEIKFLSIDQFGNVFPCMLQRLYNNSEKFLLNYDKINRFEYEFCYECESLTTTILERNGLERMV